MKWFNALPCGLLVMCACSDPVGPSSYPTGERHVEEWVGHYASAPDTVVLDGTPTSVQAHLDLYRSPACQLHVEFSTEDPEDWAVFHSESCLYSVERGSINLTLRMRVHYPGGNELVETSARFEPLDEEWSALVWTNLGIRLGGQTRSKD